MTPPRARAQRLGTPEVTTSIRPKVQARKPRPKRRVEISVSVDLEAYEALTRLAREARVPRAVFVRAGIDAVLRDPSLIHGGDE